jgi:hypothetical protein
MSFPDQISLTRLSVSICATETLVLVALSQCPRRRSALAGLTALPCGGARHLRVKMELPARMRVVVPPADDCFARTVGRDP